MGKRKILEWNDIQDEFNDTILLGNGASIAIDNRFRYKSLLTEARKKRLISKEIESLFDYFRTQDFEFILSRVWHTYHINKALKIKDKITLTAYNQIRDALIRVIHDIHPEYADIERYLSPISTFLSKFKTVLSLNYDLIIYWAMLYSNERYKRIKFKDCFQKSRFNYDWEEYRKPISGAKKTTLVFYPHGNLILANLIDGSEKKLKKGRIKNLLDQIIEFWNSKSYTPLFVSEGDSEQKLIAIRRSSYLDIVYNSILPSVENSIVIYGCSLDGNDDHIIESIFSSSIEKVAVSVYTGSDDYKDYCERVSKKLRMYSERARKKITYCFYDSESKNCWINS